MTTKVLSRTAILVAFATALQFFSFPLPFFPPYLQYDASEVPILIVSFLFGPLAGVLSVFAKNALTFFMGYSPSGIIGVTANFFAGGAFAFMAGMIYSRKVKTKKRAAVSLAAGIVFMTSVMAVSNYFIFLPVWGVPGDLLAATVFNVTIPFNLVKGVMTALLTFFLYKRVKHLLHV